MSGGAGAGTPPFGGHVHEPGHAQGDIDPAETRKNGAVRLRKSGDITRALICCGAQTDGMFEEHRIEPRERLALPLKLGNGSVAVTRDISASGLYFETAERCKVGLRLVFEMYLADACLRFTAQGEVVRIDLLLGMTGVAVKLLDPRLEPAK